MNIVLEPDNFKNEFVDENDNNVLIGPPILKWSFDDIESLQDFPKLFYQIAKEHIYIVKESLEIRRVGITPYLVWKTNEMPKLIGTKSAISRTPEQSRDNSYDIMMPYFTVWLNELIRTGDMDPAKDVILLLEKARLISEAITKGRLEVNENQR